MQQYSSDARCNLNSIMMQEPQCGSSAQPYTKQGAALLFNVYINVVQVEL